MEKKKQWKLVFAVNGERFELSSVDPSTTLLEFLRYETHYRGVKLGCGEGGCGACVVLKSTYDPIHELVEEHAVSSCLTLLCSINFCSITTTEGLGNSRDGFHSIHQRFSGFHASQCGFCTPGMCMSLFSALVNADKTERPNPPTGFSKLIVSEAEKAISGNICRCTGYRPIVDACKSFAADVDMEDLGLNSFWRKWGGLDVNVSVLPFYSRDGICTFPDFLKKEIKSSSNCFSNSLPKNLDVLKVSHLDVVCNNEDKSLTQCNWYSPISVEEVQDHLLKSEGAECGNRVKLVVGNTGAGVYKESYHYNKYIDLRNIPELSVMKRDSMGIVIGAAVTISDAIIALKEEKGLYQSNTRLVFTKIADHMDKVASQFIRNTASLGGNLIMAQRNAFPSDIATVLLAAGSLVNIHTGLERLVITLEEFLEQPPCNSKIILLSVRIPSWDSVRTSFSETTDSKGCKPVEETRLLFETYRAAPRPLGNAVAYLNAAFLTQICTCKMSGDLILKNLQLSFGAYGNKHAIRAKKVEEFLSGKSVTVAVLLEAIRLLKVTVVPEEGTSHSAYRSSLAVGFLYNFLCPFVKCLEEPLKDLSINISDAASSKIPKTGLKGHINAPANKASAADHLDRFDHLERPTSLLAAKQVVELSREYYPVGEPTKKVGAEIQASGEAIYVDDIPSPKDCLYGAFIYSTRPLARVKGIEFNCTSESQRIIAVISVNDIPRGGKNIGSASIFGSEPLFADDLTQYAGQPLSFVIAETQKHANMAANSAKVDYDTKNVGQPILSVEEAVERSSFFEVPSFLKPTQVGDFAKGMLEADHKIVTAKIKLGSQYYFYMETQTALAVPDEDNCMVVYSSIQCPELAQDVIAKCLGIPNHNVRVITRRVGGGFGGKAMKSLPVATACALAAYKLRRPIRIYLDRKTDMIMAGGRHPMKINYTVGFKANGKITALHIDLLINAGISEDVSPIMPHNIVGALKKYDWGALSISAKVCKTNFSSKSAMRAPGEVQGTLIAEAIIEHVASYLSVETDSIRKKNLHTFKSLKLFYGDGAGEPLEYTLPSVLDELAVSSSFHHRADVIRQFNGCNKWRKRGISCIPIVHEVRLRPTPGKVSILNDGSVAVEVGGIELGQGLWTKVKQMAAFALGQLWSDGSLDLLERVRVIQADTLSMVQGGFTAGSTTSESSCEAVRLACNVLIERLTPLKESLQEKDTVSWDTLILQANLQAVNLSASAYWVPDFSSMQYLNYGAAVSEVEIDLLTGATTMLQTDITYDCGQSLNPAVDLGQIEGAFVQGIGFFMLEEYLTNSDGLVVSDSTWTYKVPTVDTIPKQFNVKLLNSGHHQKRVLSSKASGEPPLLLAVSIYCATREAIKDARKEYLSSSGLDGSSSKFHLEVPATMPVVKELCGLDNVERYLESLLAHQ